MTFRTINDVKRANRKRGHYWFSPDTLRWFRSRIETELVAGRCFITSEQQDDNHPRLFTVREAYPDGDIGTVGSFQQHATLHDAHSAMHLHLATTTNDESE